MKTKEEIEKRINIFRAELTDISRHIDSCNVSKDEKFYDGEYTYGEILTQLKAIIPQLEWVLSEE
ncbi:MAG: hypothetical protein LBJ63_05235 [Prevotellaceae bacterium]|jgi:hypothetical protein|nr:hypothetical protein [Prevotellaceae bacterium]